MRLRLRVYRRHPGFWHLGLLILVHRRPPFLSVMGHGRDVAMLSVRRGHVLLYLTKQIHVGVHGDLSLGAGHFKSEYLPRKIHMALFEGIEDIRAGAEKSPGDPPPQVGPSKH